ncbi:TrbC/VirB2 family protein [Halobium salinum]|uniref:TrbC/VirB2 family protein n=1 Tax=Halobium salinum TaxID=1364940 RepID=A0ABD5PEE2_9EURY|nr:TrbC/VirB2 family protein [Halobium salinum]
MKGPLQTLAERSRGAKEPDTNGRSAVYQEITHLVAGAAGFVLSQSPVLAQSGSGTGDLQQIVDLLNRISQLLESVGLAAAVVGMAAAGIMYIMHKPGAAKSIGKSTIIGVIILLSAGAAIQFISQPLS